MIINRVSYSVHSLFNSIISLYGTIVQVKRIIISDTHIGTKFYKSNELLSFLKNEDFDELILAGDIIDFIKIPVFTERCMKILSSIDYESKSIIYVVGNHDESLVGLVGKKFLILSLKRDMILKKAVENLELSMVISTTKAQYTIRYLLKSFQFFRIS